MSAARSILYGDVPCNLLVPGLRIEDIATAHVGLARFHQETPHTEQKRWEIRVPRDSEFLYDFDDGVMRKGSVAGSDHKLYLHYRPDLRTLLAERRINLQEWHIGWFEACERIWQACSTALDELAREMDHVRPGFNFYGRLGNTPDRHCLRVLRYQPRIGCLAQSHYDRCGVTLRLHESHPGFYTQHGWSKRPQPAPEAPWVSCFSGEQLERATHGAVPRVWHGVDDTSSGTEPRQAMVFFGKLRPK